MIRLLPLVLVLAACSDQRAGTEAAPGEARAVAIDGSSTVFPIAEAVAEEFQKADPSRRVTIGVSGTGGGMKKLCNGEIAIAGASRPIKPSEVELCAQNGITYIELPVAYDGIAVVANPKAEWVESMTVEELKAIWRPEAQGEVLRWSQVRADWPDAELRLFGAGVDSGTYDYFTHAVVGTEHASRGDFTSSEDDNVLVQGVSTDTHALGFFGYAYYLENADDLKLLAVDDGVPDNGDGPIAPSPVTVADGTYQPLSRPVFLYVSAKDAERKEVQDLVRFTLHEGRGLVSEVGYIPLPDRAYELVQARFDERVGGSLFDGAGSKVGVTVLSLLEPK